MAYSGAVQVIMMHAPTPAESIVALDIGQDFSTGADKYVLMVPVPLMIYAFGIQLTESLAATSVGNSTLQHSSVIVGTDTLISTLVEDNTELQSGDGSSPLVTSSTGSEDIDAGDVMYAPASDFPFLVPAAQVLTVAQSASNGAGEGVPFIICRWQGMDLRPAAVWGDAT